MAKDGKPRGTLGRKPGHQGRVTAKGSPGAKGGHGGGPGTTTSGRYTPPIPRDQKVSPPWVPVVMFGCLGLGVALIVLNYLNLLPGDASNVNLLIGLGLITAGFVTATQYH